MKRRIGWELLGVIVLSGCTAAPEGDIQMDYLQMVQSDVLAKAEQAGMLDPMLLKPAIEKSGLTEQDAHLLVTEPLRSQAYTAELSEELLAAGGDEQSMHDFFVFDVKDDAGIIVGSVAVDQMTGEKYHYLGEGILEPYETFPLYDPQEQFYHWEGRYLGERAWMQIINRNEQSFQYIFSDGTMGIAQITGNTAETEDGRLQFLYSDEMLTVIGGTVTGNYTKPKL